MPIPRKRPLISSPQQFGTVAVEEVVLCRSGNNIGV
jgi:hypothetical protein